MSNNLRQIAKDLRSFVKRCKDVHYSDSLLISFLITGLLTIAPKLHADVASEQQEITAQTYDAITDLRQSFMRARKENEKSLKGAQSELVQLLKQGDQVIKSPWASFQFGTGYTNNDWGTTYRGRGGKYLEYYRRDNDLTKYVFDKDKHLYGATNLNIPRNQEPDALTINPANVHKPYTPAEVTKLDAMTLPTAPTFSPKAITPNSGYYKPYEFSTTKATFDPANPTTTDLQYNAYDGRNNLTGWGSNNNNNDTTITRGTFITRGATASSTYGSGRVAPTLNAPGDFNIVNTSGNHIGNITKITGDFRSNMESRHYDDGGATSTYYSDSDTWYGYVTFNGETTSNYYGTAGPVGVGALSGLHGRDMTGHHGTLNAAAGSPDINHGYVLAPGSPLGTGTSIYNPSIIYNDNNNLQVDTSYFVVDYGGFYNKNNSVTRNAIFNKSGTLTVSGTSWTGNMDGSIFSNDISNLNNGYDVANPGASHWYAGVYRKGTSFLIKSRNANGIYNVGTAIISNVNGSDNFYDDGNKPKVGYGFYIDNGGVANANNVEGSDAIDNKGTLTVSSSSFGIGSGSSNNGINARSGSTNTINYDSFTINGSSNNGINAQSGSTVDVDNSSFAVGGSSNNGINAQSGSTVDVDYSSFTVGGSSNNGMVFSNGANSNKLTNITTSVTGTSSNGILFYNGNGSGDNSTVTLENLDGSVSGGNSSSIINMHNLANLVFKTTDDNRDTHFAVTGSSIGIDVNNSGLEKKDLKFGTTSNDKVVEMTLTGYRNVGININGGLTNGTETDKEVSIGKDTAPANGLDVAVVGNENVVYNNYGYAHKLTIENGKTPMATTALAGNGRIIIGAWNNGNVLGYNKNIIFANQGYVQGTNSHDSSVKLNHIEVAGDENTIAYFAKGNGQYSTNNWLSTNNPNVGFFDGNVELQGVIGKYELHNNNGATPTPTSTPSDKISENNVGVYASSGQRNTLTTDMIGQTTPVTLNDLKITNLNIGVGPYAEHTTLVYADNETVVDVANTNTSVLGVASTISDGQLLDTTNKWGYGVAYDALSDYTTIGYAKGIFNSNANNFLNNMTHGLDTLPSEVKFSSNVDMVSKHGVAYHADAGGKISAKLTRAGGWQSIIGLAEGSNGNTENGTTYKNMIKGGDTTEPGSIVVVEGNIVAADNSLFSTDSIVSRGRITTDKQFAYDNAAGVAKNGGKVVFKKATAATTTKEGSINTAPDKSIIFGLGGYAEGTGSQVIYTSKTLDPTDGASALIVSGTKGALYATDNGYVEFNGNIIHKNNAGSGKSTGTSNEGAGITTAAENVGGTGLSGNDHRNVPIFYVNRKNANDTAGITFNDGTIIDLYDGILLTGDQYYHGQTRYWNNAIGNDYNGHYSDYYKEDNKATSDSTAWEKAKYRGMKNVTVNLVSSADGEIDLGLVNQASKEIEWDQNQDKTGGTFLTGIGEFAGGMTIKNGSTANNKSTSTAMGANSSIINGKFKISTKVDLSDNIAKNNNALFVTGTANKISNDPFNNIKMESEYVTIDSGALVAGDGTNLAGQGLNMANSLFRWDKDNVTYRRSKNTESGYENSGEVNVWGGSDTDAVTGINVAYGTIENKDSGKVYVDHGNALVGTDGSILTNKGKIVVTGLYDPATQSAYTSGITNAPTAAAGRSVETTPKGENYGIVGISTKDVLDHSNYNRDRYGENKVNITNIADGANGTIEVAGEMAVGIYANNVNQKNYMQNVNDSQFAKSNDVTVEYDNQNATSADAIKLNYGTNGAAKTPMQQNKALHGAGIALVETDKDFNAAYRGGIINLNTKNNGIGQTADILTFENGIGVYGESAKINFKGDSTGLTVDTGSDGAGIWVTDDSTISSRADRLGTPKTLNYNYKGYNDKKGFGMIFGSTDPNNKYSGTTAENYLDIKFNNNGDTNLTLATEKAQTSPGTITANKGTTRGIAGILVNTDTTDYVKNYGDIKEDKSKTNVRAYGAVVNRGHFENHGNIELSDSLNEDASNVEKNDLKKVNAGIIANYHDKDARENTWIVNHGDIKVGTNSSKNVGGFGIYGY